LIRVLIVEQIRLICDIIATALEDESDIDVIGCCTAPDVAANIDACDVMLVSAGLPDNGALDLIRTVVHAGAATKAVVFGLPELEPVVVHYIEAGAAGYVPHDASLDELLDNIRAASDGRALVSPEVAAALMLRISELASPRQQPTMMAPASVELTPRQREVLQLIRRGLTNRDIAEELVIEVGTVKNHVHRILAKLNADNRHEAAAYLSMMDYA
jgi:two-component system nitrate/nitrite response regulator NarL